MQMRLQASTWLLLSLCLDVQSWTQQPVGCTVHLRQCSGVNRGLVLSAKRRYDDEDDVLDYELRRKEERRRARAESDEDDDQEPLFQFPWQKAPPPKQRQKKYSGGQELTGFWLWLRDLYDQVFWYDIDFEEGPYQPQKRFDGNFERSSDPFSSQPSSKPPRGQQERPKRSVRSEYDPREPRQKFGGDGRGSRSRTASGISRGSGSEVYPKPARATPGASWRPAVRSRRDDDDDDYYYEDEDDAEEETDRVRNGRSGGSDRGGKRRSTRSSGAARQSEVALRLAELEEEAKDLEEKTLACEEKLAVVNVNQALWGRRLQEAVSASSPTEECRRRLEELAVELAAGELEAQELALALEDIYAELKDFEDEAKELGGEVEASSVEAESSDIDDEVEASRPEVGSSEEEAPFVMVESRKDPSKS